MVAFICKIQRKINMSEQYNSLSQRNHKTASFSCKKRKNKCLNKSLNTTFIKPRTKKNNAEKYLHIPCRSKDYHAANRKWCVSKRNIIVYFNFIRSCDYDRSHWPLASNKTFQFDNMSDLWLSLFLMQSWFLIAYFPW